MEFLVLVTMEIQIFTPGTHTGYSCVATRTMGWTSRIGQGDPGPCDHGDKNIHS